MVEPSDEPKLLDRTRSSPGPAHVSAKSFRAGIPHAGLRVNPSVIKHAPIDVTNGGGPPGYSKKPNVPDNILEALPPPAPPPLESGQEKETTSIEQEEKEIKPNIARRFYNCFKVILFSSWLNVLLVFVPVGIALQIAHVDKTIVFAMNAIAIVPLAGLLSYATENVASDLGDTIGSLMNVTFGNAVELIIFIIALTKNQIPIVQASLLGSILANLLLILGMCFLFGGLRFREQIYNSTVTQMSACLLSLSVMSLLLPTAFHASFDSNDKANRATLDISRGTSVILLLVYVLYLLFQLKSHAYMYQSTPQHVIDEESHPGLLHDVFDTSSSSGDSASSSSSDSNASSGSNTTAKRIKRVLTRGRRRRKSSGTSTDSPSARSMVCSPSLSTFNGAEETSRVRHANNAPSVIGYASGEEGDVEASPRNKRSTANKGQAVTSRDFENERFGSGSSSRSSDAMRKKSKKKHLHYQHHHAESEKVEVKSAEAPEPISEVKSAGSSQIAQARSRVVGFQDEVQAGPENSPKRPFNFRGLLVRDALPNMPAMPKIITNTVFSTANPPSGPMAVTGVTPRALHRSHSLPSRLNQTARLANQRAQAAPTSQPQPHLAPVNTNTMDSDDPKAKEKHISRIAAFILLVSSTGLVALCAEFLIDSIDHFVKDTSVSQAFVGLIILPIVGNAAEHVCAVTVASKNKMDLAIGVAVGSSIQIALFVTPVIVLLGWMMKKEMSLYFSLFETISLFVSAFIVNFLVLDGRSNYLEGALLIAAYVIIALAAFFYPDDDEASSISGDNNNSKALAARMLTALF